MPINTPKNTPVCAACGCSLVRLKIGKDEAVAHRHGDEEYLFCCQGCVDVFAADPEKLLREYEQAMDNIAVCPACLGEKPLESTVEVEHDGEILAFCRCPHCKEAFDKDPERLLSRLVW